MHRVNVLSDMIAKFICPRVVWNLWIFVCSNFYF